MRKYQVIVADSNGVVLGYKNTEDYNLANQLYNECVAKYKKCYITFELNEVVSGKVLHIGTIKKHIGD